MVRIIPSKSLEIICADRKQELRSALERTRNRTLRLLDRVPEEFLKIRVHYFYSPIGWHFGHIGRTEEFWVSHKAFGRELIDSGLSFLFADLPENPKDNRINLPSRGNIVRYLQETREASLDDLESADLGSSNPYLNEGYAWSFAVQHECQHQETVCEMLQLIQMKRVAENGVGPLDRFQGTRNWSEPEEAQYKDIPGGCFMMGCGETCVYDNEKQPHQTEVAQFRIARSCVTASQWMVFISEGGYMRPEFWSPKGWSWKISEEVDSPEYWQSTALGYLYIGPQGPRDMDPSEPVSCLSWYEAEAYLNWSRKRFPTEEEWEFAAGADGCRFPWGNEFPNERTAVFGGLQWKPMPVGSKPCGVSRDGINDLAGNVWEWTSSPFLPYPGFEAFPYDGYSKDHMLGGHYVCRGGSWATAAPILRNSFRNWYVPTYRQGFLGLRCADD